MGKASVQLQKHRGKALGWKDPPAHHHHGDVLIVSVCRHAGRVEGWRVRRPGAWGVLPTATCCPILCAPAGEVPACLGILVTQGNTHCRSAECLPGCHRGLASSWTFQEGCFTVLETCPDAQSAKPSVAAGSRGGENTSQDSLWGLLFL